MLKKRIVASLILQNDIVVQSIGFKNYLPIGSPTIAVEYLNKWGIDEIVLLDISATKQNKPPNFRLIKEAASKCQVPLAVGGGITNLEQMHQLMQCGADKICLNSAAIKTPNLITNAAHVYGDQCVVVSIDVIKVKNDYKVYTYWNDSYLDLHPANLAKHCQNLGAGEIFINCVDNDGKYIGFNEALINEVCSKISVPVIACGGAKTAHHFISLFNNTHVHAACAGNLFQFTEHSVNILKAQINKQIPIRLETHANYSDNNFDVNGRLSKKPDHILEELLYIKIEQEVI